jgi:hypothetical protein
MKVTCYTAIALCCKKMAQMMEIPSSSELKIVDSFQNVPYEGKRNASADNPKRSARGNDTAQHALDVKGNLLGQVIAYGYRAADVIEELERISTINKKKNDKRVDILRDIKKIKKHDHVKFLCLMRSKVSPQSFLSYMLDCGLKSSAVCTHNFS